MNRYWHKLALTLKSVTPAAAILLAASCVLVFLTIRNCGLNPSIFDDEWIYSKFSRLASRSEAPVPSYLFFFVFGFTRLSGDGFLECARIFNAVFFAIAIFFIYRIGRRYTPAGVALFIALLSALGPFSVYSAFFMPESMYYCAFWIFAWFLLSSIGQSPWTLGTGSGAILGLMALIKFHAIFLLPGLAIFLLLVWLTKSANLTFQNLLRTLLLASAAFFIIRLTGGYLLADGAGLRIAGDRYSSFGSPFNLLTRFLALGFLTWHSLVGNLLAISFLLSLPLAAILGMDWRRTVARHPSASNPKLLQIFGLSFLLPLLLVVAFSTAMFANGSPYDTADRLHLRYYSFIFPLFFLISAAELRVPNGPNIASRRRLILALAIGAACLFAVFAGLNSYTPNIVDSPELSLKYQGKIFFLSGVFSAVSVLLWSVKRNLGSVLYLFLFLPLAATGAGQRNAVELGYRRFGDDYDNAGRFARQVLGKQTSRLTIVASDQQGLYRALFSVDNPNTRILEIPPEAPFDRSSITAGQDWVLIVGDHRPRFSAGYQISLGTLALLKVSADNLVDFRDRAWPGVLDKITGISTAEQFGRWTLGSETVINFIDPLPKKMKVVLKAAAIGPNVDLPFRMTIGKQTQQFRLSQSVREVTLFFETDEAERTVKIEIPKPISPKELRNSPDERALGAALEQLSISETS